MPKSALLNHRPWLLLSLVAGIGFYWINEEMIGGVWWIALKGAAVGCLAIYAFWRTAGLDGAILTVSLALSAAGDMALEINFGVGGGLFFAAHCAAIVMFIRNVRPQPTRSQILCAIALMIVTPIVAYLLSHRLEVALYCVGLGLMAGAAWMSRFPRYRVGLGAVLFVCSDWLIFSRLGSIDLAPLPDALVWPLYFSAQFLIATGVVQTLRAKPIAAQT